MQHCGRFVIIVVLCLSSLPALAAGGKGKTVFVADFELKSFPDAELKKLPSGLGAILASELQATMQKLAGYQPVTISDLKAQMKKDTQAELMGCTDDSCTAKVVDEFGVHNSAFGSVTYLGPGEVYLSITHMKQAKVIGTVTGTSKGSVSDHIKAVAGLAHDLMKLEKQKSEDIDVTYSSNTTLVVESVPGGGTIYIDDKDTGKQTPYTFFGLSEGPHEIKVMSPPFYGTDQVKLEADKKSKVKLMLAKKQLGALKVTTIPAGATIKIFGKERGMTPTVLTDVEAGPIKLEIELSGYAPIEETVEIIGDDMVTIDRTLQEPDMMEIGITGIFGPDHYMFALNFMFREWKWLWAVVEPALLFRTGASKGQYTGGSSEVVSNPGLNGSTDPSLLNAVDALFVDLAVYVYEYARIPIVKRAGKDFISFDLGLGAGVYGGIPMYTFQEKPPVGETDKDFFDEGPSDVPGFMFSWALLGRVGLSVWIFSIDYTYVYSPEYTIEGYAGDCTEWGLTECNSLPYRKWTFPMTTHTVNLSMNIW